MIARLRPIWPWITLVVSGALLAGAHGFERIGGLAPCPLCLDQRKWHWAVVAVSVAALVLARFVKGRERVAAALLGLVLLGAAGQAMHHVAVEQHWITWTCAADVELGEIRAFGADDGPVEVPACDEPAWIMWGVSMAGYNALISLIAALASFVVAFAPGRKP